MAESLVKYTAVTGIVTINVQNPNRDGTGTLGTVLTATQDGVIINSITVKAVNSTSQGMVRLFIDNGAGTVLLFKEQLIPATTPSSKVQTYSITIPITFPLQSGYILKASTEKSEDFIITAEASSWENCSC